MKFIYTTYFISMVITAVVMAAVSWYFRRNRTTVPGALIILLAVMTAGIITAGFINYRLYIGHYRIEAERQLSAIADLKVNDLVQWRNERLSDGNILSGNTAFSNLVKRFYLNPADSNARIQIQTWLNKIKTSYQYRQIYLTDKIGNIIISIPQQSENKIEELTKYLNEARMASGVILTDLHRISSDKPIHLSVIAPVTDEYNSEVIAGFAVLVIDPEIYLYPFLKRWPAPSESAETQLVRRDGDDVLFLNELKFRENTALNFRVPLTDPKMPVVMAALGHEGVVNGIDYRGVHVVAALRSVPGTPWHLAVVIDINELYGPVTERFWIMVIIFIGFIGAAGIGVTSIWRKQSENFYKEKYEAAEQLIITENKLKTADDRFNTIFYSNVVGIIIADFNGSLIEVNDYFLNMIGYTREDFAAGIIRWDKITPPEYNASDMKALEELLSSGICTPYEKEYIRKDGTRMWVLLADLLIPGPERHIFAFAIDVTGRKQAEETRRDSEIRYRKLFEAAKDGILILDAETGMVVDVNPFLIDMLKFSREQFLGKTIWDLGFFIDIIANKEKFLELQEKEYLRYENIPLKTADGRRMEVEFINTVYEINQKKVIQCNIRDISDRIKIQNELKHFTDELERSNLELQQFAYVASHDLQEPLRMISSYLQLIERRYKDKLDADANDFIHFAVDGANRLQALIIGLLEFSRIKTHGKPFTEVNVKNILEKVVSDLRLQIEETGAVVEYAEMPVIAADELQIARLFQNLIHNSIKFRRKDVKPVVKISSERTGGNFLFCVSDNGIGMEKQYYDRIFNIFQRLHTREEYPGTGIGLSICKRIVERHGGTIRIESKPGEGSSFYFTISGGLQ